MLETIKAYATAMLAQRPDFADAARDAHARYFADLAKHSTTEAAATDLDNLRVAQAHAVARQDLKLLNALREALRIYERGGTTRRSSSPTTSIAVRASSPERHDDWQTQLTLLTSRAEAMTLLRGYTGETEDAYAEALALVKEHGEVPQLFRSSATSRTTTDPAGSSRRDSRSRTRCFGWPTRTATRACELCARCSSGSRPGSAGTS